MLEQARKEQRQRRLQPVLLPLAQREPIRELPCAIDEQEQIGMGDHARRRIPRALNAEVVQEVLHLLGLTGDEVPQRGRDPLRSRKLLQDLRPIAIRIQCHCDHREVASLLIRQGRNRPLGLG